jgi:hypothetical protein
MRLAVDRSVRIRRLLYSCILVFIFPFRQQVLNAADNPIVLENQRPGTNQWQLWQPNFRVADDSSKQIKGYASATSVDLGQPITFYVSVNSAQTYTIDIYRMGWYQGLGGRFMQRIGPLSGAPQPACPTDASTGLMVCAWSPAYTLTPPTDWTSGVYLALLTNSQNYQNYINFVIRDDARYSDLLYQESVTTFQAYNNYPNDNSTGKSLYDYNSYGAKTVTGTTEAAKVTFDRPYSNNGDGQFLTWEVYFVQWLERSGYDVTYSTDVDTEAGPGRLLNHKAFLSVGHDEYWSLGMRTAAEQARDAGIHLGFFSANAVYWQVRFEPSASGIPNRVLVCYKSTSIDPVQGPTTTVRWRDPYIARPEQSLIGMLSTAQISNNIDQTAAYIVTNSAHWVYSGTGLQDGVSIPKVVGYEADRYQSQYPSPTSINGTYTLLSRSPIVDLSHGSDYSNSSIYQAPSGAWVFAGGTISWAWALGRSGYTDARIQQTTTNILNRFIGVIGDPPTPPSNLAATAISSSQINLSWTDNSLTETNFVVERSSTSAFTTTTNLTLPADQTALNDTGLAAGTTYYYRVRATNQYGGSIYSNVSSAKTTAPNLPNAPIGLTVTGVSANQVDLMWTDNATNETSEIVERSLSSSFSSITTFTLPTDQTTFSNSGLAGGTTYYYRVKAVNQAGSSNYSNVVNATTLSAPKAPSGLAATPISTTQINLSWTDNSNNEVNFVLERSLTSGFASVTSTLLPADQTTFSDVSLESTTYYYRVKAVNANGSSTYSNTASASTTTPSAPTALSASPSGNRQHPGISLKWTDNANNETSFVIERSTDNFTFSVVATVGTNTTSYKDSAVTNSKLYYYRVKAMNTLGESGYSNTASAKTP